jgi:hypothetical protein
MDVESQLWPHTHGTGRIDPKAAAVHGRVIVLILGLMEIGGITKSRFSIIESTKDREVTEI